MGSFSLWHWLVVLVIVLVLFGRGRVADIMGEFGKGINSFKKGVNEENRSGSTPTPSQQIEGPGADSPPSATSETATPTSSSESGNNG
jgi:sec-independent protein translocase protein TatA